MDKQNFARRAILGTVMEMPLRESDDELEQRIETMFVDAYAENQQDRADDIEREATKQAEVQKRRDSILERDKSITSPLTDNDRAILVALLELDASIVKPESARTIIETALYAGDQKRAFRNLKLNKLVDAKQGKRGGYWLTEKGLEVARSLE